MDDAALDRVHALACEAVGKSKDELTLDAPLAELGLDSLDMAELLLDVERVFEIRISDEAAVQLRTLRDVAALVSRGGTALPDAQLSEPSHASSPQPTAAQYGTLEVPVVTLPQGDDARVVITGMGVVTPLGSEVRVMFDALLAGKSGVGMFRGELSADARVRIGAHAAGFDEASVLGRTGKRRFGRFSLMAVAAARQAVQASGLLQAGYAPERIAVVIGVGIGGIENMDRSSAVLHTKGARYVPANAIIGLIPNMAAGLVAQELGARGPCFSVASACASGGHAMGQALQALRMGVVDAVVTGGAEASLTPLGLAAFAQIGALSRRNDEPARASRPFERDRDGFVMGEGAGVLVLERLGPARKRGAHIHAELAGYGATADAHHPAEPDPHGQGAALAILGALQDARMSVDAIDYVNAHGTSTPFNDRVETIALKRAFGSHAPKLWVSSTKSMTGHLLGAAGAVEAIISALAVESGHVPPTINLDAADPSCDLDYVPNVAREGRIRAALTNSFAFGGQNACLVLRALG